MLACGYLTIFAAPLVAYFLIGESPLWVLALLFVMFVLNPAWDFFLQRFLVTENAWKGSSLKSRAILKWLPYLGLPLQILLVFRAFESAQEGWVMATAGGVLCGLSAGVVGIASAHELTHRRSRWDQSYGGVFLLLIGYPHFAIEHAWHHRRVATLDDPDTARKGESLYLFLVRSVPEGLRASWRTQPVRMARLMAVSLAILLFIGVYWGGFAAWAYLIQSFVTIFLLKWINYVEHYGLLRGPSQPHSWDSHSPVTNWSLFNLGFHTQHHKNASLPYFKLPQAATDSNLLPAGYPAMMVLALVPFFWRKVMDSRVKLLREVRT